MVRRGCSRAQGEEKHGRKRIARLMRAAGLVGASRRRSGVTTRGGTRKRDPPLNLVDRNFVAARPNQLWVADITFVPTASGFLYLAVVPGCLEPQGRRLVDGNHLRTELVLDALEMAIGQRRPDGVIHHSDQGSQGGINWSSQHNREECCDGRETAVGSSVTGQVEVARAAGDGAT